MRLDPPHAPSRAPSGGPRHADPLPTATGRPGWARVISSCVGPLLRSVSLLALVGGVILGPDAARLSGQTVEELMEGIRNGGGWVQIPIEEGRARIETTALPTMGLVFTGCAKVWDGHSGRWSFDARDALGTATVEAEQVEPGDPVPFTAPSGLRSRLELEIRWSEPRDTTLSLWVGLEREGRRGERACEPPGGGDSDTASTAAGRLGIQEATVGQPPAIAPTTWSGSAPARTSSGSGRVTDAWDRSSPHAKKRIRGRRPPRP